MSSVENKICASSPDGRIVPPNRPGKIAPRSCSTSTLTITPQSYTKLPLPHSSSLHNVATSIRPSSCAADTMPGTNGCPHLLNIGGST